MIFDKNSKEIREFDLIRVFHFIGARRKKHYMYKWVVTDPKFPDILFGDHLDGAGSKFYLGKSTSDKGITFDDIEIIQSPRTLMEEINVQKNISKR
jgi:hypothetical protein